MKQGTRAKDLVMPRGMPRKHPALRMGTTHTEAWLRVPRVCTTRGCPERYAFRPRCRTCSNLTEAM